MSVAIGLAGLRGEAAEPEILGRWIADRPFASAFGQLHQREPARLLFHLADRGERLGLISPAEGCGGRGWPATGTGFRAAGGVGVAAGAGSGRAADGAAAAGFAAGWAGLVAEADFASAFGSASRLGLCRFGCPADAVSTAPAGAPCRFTGVAGDAAQFLAIWLADWPSAHIFFSVSTRSSVQDMMVPRAQQAGVRHPEGGGIGHSGRPHSSGDVTSIQGTPARGRRPAARSLPVASAALSHGRADRGAPAAPDACRRLIPRQPPRIVDTAAPMRHALAFPYGVSSMIPTLLPTYNRAPLAFVRGEGTWLIAEDGGRYIDLGAGIAVNALRPCQPRAVAALTEQAGRVWMSRTSTASPSRSGSPTFCGGEDLR